MSYKLLHKKEKELKFVVGVCELRSIIINHTLYILYYLWSYHTSQKINRIKKYKLNLEVDKCSRLLDCLYQKTFFIFSEQIKADNPLTRSTNILFYTILSINNQVTIVMDKYSHDFNSSIIYIVENILGPTECSEAYNKLAQEYNSQLLHICDCTTECKETCKCIDSSGGVNYIQDKNVNKLKLNTNKSQNTYPIYECTELCACSKVCGNRLVQYGPLRSLIVKIAENKLKGLGLFTEKFISKGTFICEYAGEVITKSQALLRHNLNREHGKMNYIFCLNEHVNNTVIQTFIDPSTFGNIGRYINHSCNPNCCIIPVRVDSPIPKLAIFSCADISPGEEITFNYGLNNISSITEISHERVTCLCESSICKGIMPLDVY